MWLVAVGLLALVVYLGRQSPGPAATTMLPPENNVPPVGAGPVPSPAKYGGSPYNNATNQIGLRASTTYVDSSYADYKMVPTGAMWAARQRSVVGGNYMTDQDSSLMTQNVPPLVVQVPNGTPTGQKL